MVDLTAAATATSMKQQQQQAQVHPPRLYVILA